MKFIKVKNDIFYTPIIRHKRGSLTITNIGAVHIGMEKYYDRLQSEIDKYSFGFFEGVKPLENEENIPDDKKQYIDCMKGLKGTYRRFAGYMKAVTQERLKYPKSWKNPDMTIDELVTSSSPRVLNGLSGMEEQIEMLDKIYQSNPKEIEAIMKSTMKLISGPSILNNIIEFIAMGSAYKKVILGERNQLLFNALEQEIKEPRTENMTTIYGAGHLEGIDKFLKNKGFSLKGGVWIPALDLHSEMSYWQAVKSIAKKGF